MDVIHPRCAGVDISKRDAKVCVRIAGPGRAKAKSTVTTWGAVTNQVLALREHLIAEEVTLMVMEATSDYWKPFYYLLQCGYGVASGSMGARSLMGSVDSGRTFRPLPDPGPGAGYDDTGIEDAGNGHAVIATTGNNRGALLSTSDGGRSWHESLSLSGDQVAVFGDLGFEDATHGVVVVGGGAAAGEQGPYGGPAGAGAGTVYRTTDSGRTWTRLAFR